MKVVDRIGIITNCITKCDQTCDVYSGAFLQVRGVKDVHT